MSTTVPDASLDIPYDSIVRGNLIEGASER